MTDVIRSLTEGQRSGSILFVRDLKMSTDWNKQSLNICLRNCPCFNSMENAVHSWDILRGYFLNLFYNIVTYQITLLWSMSITFEGETGDNHNQRKMLKSCNTPSYLLFLTQYLLRAEACQVWPAASCVSWLMRPLSTLIFHPRPVVSSWPAYFCKLLRGEVWIMRLKRVLFVHVVMFHMLHLQWGII